MVISEDTGNRIVIIQSKGIRISLRIMGGILGGVFISIGIYIAVKAGFRFDIPFWVFMGLLSLLFFFYYAGYFKEMTFDYLTGLITWREGSKRFPNRVRTFSKTAVQSIDVRHTPTVGEASEALHLSIILRAKKVKLHTDSPYGNDSVARLANRLSNFVGIRVDFHG